MRKIISKSQEEKSRNRKQLSVGLILIAIMLMSVIGYGFVGKEEENAQKVNYNGFEFVKKNEFWITKTGNLQFVFKYNPKEIEKIGGDLKDLENYYGKPVYISSDDNEVVAEIYTNLNQIVQRMQKACLEGEKCEDKNLPIKTCKDNFIVVKESENSKIEQKENCVFIYGKQEDLLKLGDEFLFKILKIEQ